MKKTTLLSFFFTFMSFLAISQIVTPKHIDDFKNFTQAEITLNKNLGIPSFIKFPLNQPLTLNGNSLKDKVDYFLKTNKNIYAIENVNEAFTDGTIKIDNYGLKHYVVKQNYKGVPVYDAELRFHFNRNESLNSINGNTIPSININAIPDISKQSANNIAINLLKNQNINHSGKPLKVITNELYVFPKGIVQGYVPTNYLAYRIEIRNDVDVREYLFIDAHNGKLVEQFTGIAHALNRSLYEEDFSNKVYSEGESTDLLNQWQKNEIETAGHSYYFFKNAFNFLSYDNADAEMITVHNDPNINCPNANWNGVSANYCDGLASDDVVAHEWGHAYTEYTCGLVYAYQSGALSESLSDIWGETIDLLNGYQDDLETDAIRTTCNSSDRWMIGEDVDAQDIPVPLRDMWRPTCFGSPGKVTDDDYFCDPNFVDSGGVHYNSGIPNHAYALMVDGGNYNGQSITGIGFVKAAHIIWRAQSQYLTATSSFKDFANAVEAASNDLIGINLEGLSTSEVPAGLSGEVISVDDVNQVVKSLIAVELREDINCQYQTILQPVDQLCDAAFDNAIYYQDWENGIPSNWTISQIPVNPGSWESRDWILETNLPKGRPGQAIFAPTPAIGDCVTDLQNGILRLESPTFTMPNYQNGDFEMAFLHSISTEPLYDGGNLKYSLNGDPWATIPSYAFFENSYNVILSTDDNTNPMMGEEAFSGIDQGAYDYSQWGVTIVNLSILGVGPNSNLKLRWELGSDGCNGITGWFVDDIVIYNCSEALSINDVDYLNNNINIYPNPSTGIFNIKMKSLEDFTFDIYDITGKIIMSKIDIVKNEFNLDLSSYSKGLYFIKLKSSVGTITKKLILR
jgi:bacillolysin